MQSIQGKKKKQYVILLVLKIINQVTNAKNVKNIVKKYPNEYQFCNEDINKFVLLLRNFVYPYKYMDNWERFNETSSPDKKIFTMSCI